MESTLVLTTPAQDEKQNAPLLLSAEKVAELLDVSVRTLWRLRAAGRLPAPIRLGGSVRWLAQDIYAWIASGCPAQRSSATPRKNVSEY